MTGHLSYALRNGSFSNNLPIFLLRLLLHFPPKLSLPVDLEPVWSRRCVAKNGCTYPKLGNEAQHSTLRLSILSSAEEAIS